jgi:SRSO17 transposase
MTLSDIVEIEEDLREFLAPFGELFHRSEARRNLRVYIGGQLSDLPRKSVEPIALAANVDERSLQLFLSTRDWDHERMRDMTQQIVARDHAGLDCIGVIDETGHPKKGGKTPGVGRQYCGNSGKIDNCIVTVHLAASRWDDSFTAIIDSDLFLPEDWSKDAARRQEAKIPDTVSYRAKWKIALEQTARALANGVPLTWVTADEYYGGKPGFLVGIIDLNCSVVAEVPKNFRGWTSPPVEATQGALKTSKVVDLAKHSVSLHGQPWVSYRIKDTEKGPIVWEARATPFAFKHCKRIIRNATLIVARNTLNPNEVKYFVAIAPATASLEDMLHVAFARSRVEDKFLRAKDEMGLSHYEGRTYLGLLRHCYVTALSLLFAIRQTNKMRKKKSGGHHLPDPPCNQCADRSVA